MSAKAGEGTLAGPQGEYNIPRASYVNCEEVRSMKDVT